MSEKLYGVDQFYPGDFAQILTGVYTCHRDAAGRIEKKEVQAIMNRYCTSMGISEISGYIGIPR